MNKNQSIIGIKHLDKRPEAHSIAKTIFLDGGVGSPFAYIRIKSEPGQQIDSEFQFFIERNTVNNFTQN